MSTINFDYVPRKAFTPLHKRTKRFSSLCAHRRSGKTFSCVADLTIRALHSTKHNPRYAFIAPYRSQAKDVAWVYLKGFTKNFATRVREADLRVELPNGSWITLYGSDNPDALRGKYFDGATVDEIADCRPNLFEEVLMPALSDRAGWIVFIGTARGKNHFHRIHKNAIASPNDWYSMTLKASESGILPQSELDLMRSMMTEAQYEQELECSFEAPVLGTYYAGIINQLELNNRITHNPDLYNPDMPVYVALDLGFTDSTAIWFWQPALDGIAIIRYYEAHSEPLQHYFDYFASLDYTYASVYLPHDARAKTLQTGKSTVEQFLDFFTEYDNNTTVEITPMLSIQHGIDAARLIMPQCSFDLTHTEQGVEMLRAYRRTYNENTKAFSDKPRHDFTSHCCLAGDTLVDTPQGQQRLDSIKAGDKVLIAGQTANVSWAGCTGVKETIKIEFTDGTSTTATPQHKFFTTFGLVLADSLRHNDHLLTSKGVEQWSASEKGIREAFTESFKASDTTCGLNEVSMSARQGENSACCTGSSGNTLTEPHSRQKQTSPPSTGIWTISALRTGLTELMKSLTNRKTYLLNTSPTKASGTIKRQNEGTTQLKATTLPTTCIALFGKITSVKYRQNITSTTLTRTRGTIVSTILNFLRNQNTQNFTPAIAHGLAAHRTPPNYAQQGTKLKRGTLLRRVLNGIQKTPKNAGKNVKNTQKCVISAATLSIPTSRPEQDSVIKTVKRITAAGPQPVFDLTVDLHHAYVANGVAVSNSDSFRYLALNAKQHLKFIKADVPAQLHNPYVSQPAIVQRYKDAGVSGLFHNIDGQYKKIGFKSGRL